MPKCDVATYDGVDALLCALNLALPVLALLGLMSRHDIVRDIEERDKLILDPHFV